MGRHVRPPFLVVVTAEQAARPDDFRGGAIVVGSLAAGERETRSKVARNVAGAPAQVNSRDAPAEARVAGARSNAVFLAIRRSNAEKAEQSSWTAS